MQNLKINIKTTLIFCFIILLPPFIANPIFSTLDDSWGLGLGISTIKNFVFGNDIVFTYGPLHFLIVKQGNLLHLKFVTLIFELASISFLMLIFSDIYKKMTYDFKGIILVFTAFIFSHINCEYYLTFIFIYSSFQILVHNKYVYLVALFVVSSLSFFIKINYGFVYIFFMTLLLVVLSVKNLKNIIYLLLTLILTFITIYFLSFYLNTDLKNYTTNGFQIIKGYLDGMSSPINFKQTLYWYGVIVFGIFIYLQFYYHKEILSIKYSLFFILLYGFVFLAFKNGIVRIDGHHYFIFLYQFPMYFLIFYLIVENQKRLNQVLFIVIFLSFVNICHGLYNNAVLKISPRITKKMLSEKINFWGYFPSLFTNVQEKYTNVVSLQNEQLRLISNKSVDVFPTDISLMLKHKLNYNPRPILQSYSAYNKVLDSLNCVKIKSSNAPNFLLFLNETIDYRVPFWDESITKRGILQNYDIVQNSTQKDSCYLLFKKNIQSKVEFKTEIINFKTDINNSIKVPFDSLNLYMFANVRFNLFGKLIRFLLKTPYLKIEFIYDDNSKEVFKSVIPILETGVLINRKVTNNKEANSFFSGNLNNLKRINSFRFMYDFGIEDEIDLKFVRIEYK
ncbi:MAG: hypothetical protein EAZ27_11635 [Cytophagales bacterium]|nr:MAG: hypothetical protein EAZ27_11635 [Cytophagales bacterium]